MNNAICPKCGSSQVEIIDYQGIPCTLCKKCGYDETDEYAIVAEEKKSQKAKAQHSPYKAGGPKRTQR